MDVHSEVALNEILSRSSRLEKRTPFAMNLPFSSLLHETRTVLPASGDIEKGMIKGQLLLAQQKADVSRTNDILRGIERESIIIHEILTFREQSDMAVQNCIVDSIGNAQDKTENINESFVYNHMYDNWNSMENIRHVQYDQRCSLASPIINEADYPSLANHQRQVRMVLSPRVEFFASLINGNQNEIASSIASSIVKDDRITESHKLPLSDTFDLISSLQKNKYNHIDGATSFLENQMRRIIVAHVNRNLMIAERGGGIGIILSIKGYINLIHKKSSESPWTLLYFALRCGEIEEAIRFTRENSELFTDTIIQALEYRLRKAPLPPASMVDIKSYLRREMTSVSADNFKLATLCVLAKEPPGMINESIITSIEDWLWLRYQFATNSDLDQIYKELIQLNLDDQSNPFINGQLLIFVSKFDEACKWFLHQKEFIDENIHIALLLHISGLAGSKDLLSSLLQYAKDIFPANSMYSTKYLSLINDRSDRIQAISHLAVELEDGYMIFNSNDGNSSPVSLCLTPEDMKDSLLAAGSLAEQRDQHEAAARFFKLAGDYNRVIDNICIELRQYIEGFIDGDIVSKGGEVLKEITEFGMNVTITMIETFRIMLFIASGTELMRKGLFTEASNQFDRSMIFPVQKDIDHILEIKDRISRYHPALRMTIPSAFVNGMKTYSEAYKASIRGTNGLNFESQKIWKSQLKQKGDSILLLSGMVDIEINQEINRKLIELHHIFQ